MSDESLKPWQKEEVPAVSESANCEHWWVSTHQPDFPAEIYWVRQCGLCRTFDGADLAEQVSQMRVEREEVLGLLHATQEQLVRTREKHRAAFNEKHEMRRERDAARAGTDLAALLRAIDHIRECRSCLGAGPMDYEAFTDEVDAALDALGACRCLGDPHGYDCTAHTPLDAFSGGAP